MNAPAAAPIANVEAIGAVTEQLRLYFDGLHWSDSQRLRRVFHPEAVYATATEAAPLFLRMEEFFAVVD